MLYETREELWFHNAHLGFSHGLVMSEQMPSVLAQSNSASAGFYEDSGFRSLIDTSAVSQPLAAGDEEPIVVVGKRPPLPDWDGGGLGTGGGGGDGGSGGGGGGGGDTTTTSQDCRDHRALDAETAIEAKPDDGQREYGSIIYRGADGKMYSSAPIPGTSTSISPAQITDWLNTNGVSMSQVTGFVHNHDAWQYGTSSFEANVNRYPSGNDWQTADWMVGQGAGGAGGSGFALYVIDPDGDLREFNYGAESTYKNLTPDQKNSGSNLPQQLTPDGSTC